MTMHPIPPNSEPRITSSSCIIPQQSISDVHSLASTFNLPPSHIVQAVVALVCGIYNHSDVTNHAVGIIQQRRESLLHFGLSNFGIRNIQIDQAMTFSDFVRSLSAPQSVDGALEDANGSTVSILPSGRHQEQLQALDAIICFNGNPEDAGSSLLDLQYTAQWASLLDRFNCSSAICLPAPPSATDAFIISRAPPNRALKARNLAATFAKILSNAKDRPDSKVGRLDCLSRSDEDLLRSWNEHVAEPRQTCLHEIVSSQAVSRPRAPAVCADDGNLTYKELDRLSTILAAHLARRGIRTGSVIPICFEKSQYVVVCMLAIFKIGAACTMLEPSLPTKRLQNMIKQTSATLLLGSGTQCARFQGFVDVLEISQAFFVHELAKSEDIALPNVDPSDVATVLFTSGSTGDPKGILHEHTTIATSLYALARRLELTDSNRIAQFAAYSFDLSMIEILLPFVVGGCVCIPSEDARTDDLAKCMEEMGVTFAMLTPSSIKLLEPKNVPSLKMVMVGGEPMTAEVVRVWGQRLTLLNAWGTAECGICTCGVISDPASISVGRSVEIGTWIVDPRNIDRLLPIGAVGEVVVEGPQIAQGYMISSEPTSTTVLPSFTESPSWLKKGPNTRVYRTGDLMRFTGDDSLIYCGRKDSQIKIRGCRIEVGEIEHHITANDIVHGAVVALPKQGIYRGRLVAVVHLKDSREPIERFAEEKEPTEVSCHDGGSLGASVRAIRADLESKLPCQAVPDKWIVVDHLPISKSDKVDRNRLNFWLETRELFEQTSESQAVAGYSADPMLGEVRRMLEDALIQDQKACSEEMLAPNSLLKAHGLNSLSVITLRAAIQKSFNVKVPIQTLLQSSLTIHGLTDVIQEALLGKPSLPNTDTLLRDGTVLGDLRRLRSGLLEKKPPSVSNGFERGLGRSVFLTGATGYVGCHILQSLLCHPNVDLVCALIRAQTQEDAIARIVATARLGGWWSGCISPKLEIWLGDLSLPNLGLSADQLSRLSSCKHGARAVDSVVHNGAIVHWLADYAQLRSVNVFSTARLLDIAKSSTCISNFVFISSDPEARYDVVDGDFDTMAVRLSNLNGYRQTKAISEILVRSVALTSKSASQRISVIKPGFVVGGHERGVVNMDDFLWRFVASVWRLRTYDASESTGWLYVASVDVITKKVLEDLFGENAPGDGDESVTDGTDIAQLWKILESVTSCSLRSSPQDEWIALLRRDVFDTGDQHPLWSLLHSLEDEKIMLRATKRPSIVDKQRKADTEQVIKKGLVLLHGSELLSSNAVWLRGEATNAIFQRTELV